MDRATDEFDSVYLLQEQDNWGAPTGLYKIGCTKGDVETRMKGYRAGNPRTVREYYVIDVAQGQGRKIEAMVHRALGTHRQNNEQAGTEWFALTPPNVQRAVTIMAGYDLNPRDGLPNILFDQFQTTGRRNVGANPFLIRRDGSQSFSVGATLIMGSVQLNFPDRITPLYRASSIRSRNFSIRY